MAHGADHRPALLRPPRVRAAGRAERRDAVALLRDHSGSAEDAEGVRNGRPVARPLPPGSKVATTRQCMGLKGFRRIWSRYSRVRVATLGSPQTRIWRGL